MPRGQPKIGRQFPVPSDAVASPPTSVAAAPLPGGGTLLGDLSTTLPPASPSLSGGGPIPSTTPIIDIEDATPPWDLPGGEYHDTDARRFVDVPETWVLRWMSQRHLDAQGSRDWQPVMAYHPKVQVKAKGMVTPSHYIRRGGQGGDLLYWMPKHWHESRQKKKAAHVAKMTGDAGDTMAGAIDQARRSGYLRVDSARHPTHTMGEGASMRD